MDVLLLNESQFHNPVLKLNNSPKKKKIEEIVSDFILRRSKLMKIRDMFRDEIQLGLCMHPRRAPLFYMENTFVTDKHIPDASEDGDYLSIDLGGNNLRVIHTRLRHDMKAQFQVKHYHLSVDYRRGKAENLFNYLAECLDDFLKNNPDIDQTEPIPLGFTFSFGIKQLSLDKGLVIQFSINTDLPDAIGNDVVQYLKDAIKRKNLNIEVLALLNDTTAVTAMGRYMDPDASIGLILGSGTNICYFEKVNRIEKFDCKQLFGSDVNEVIINTENTQLGDDGALDFAKTKFDIEIDRESLFPNNTGFEKLVGGHFMGDIVRRTLLEIIKSDILLNGKVNEQFLSKDSITAPDISAIESDHSDESVIQLLHKLGYDNTDISNDDIEIIKYVCSIVSVRNALLLAASLSEMIDHIDMPMVKVAVDGSLYKHHPKMHTLITDFIEQLIPDRKFQLFHAEDGSGIGAGIVASVAKRCKRQ